MVVLDACAAYNISTKTDKGKALLTFIDVGEKIIVPAHFEVEFVNTLQKYVRNGSISFHQAKHYLNTIKKLITTYVNVDNMSEEVLAESARLKHPAYDIYYFVLARRYNAVLLTTDKRLANLCADNRVSCVHFIEKPRE